MELSIIIPSFNTKDLLRNCIESILENSKDLDYEIIVVDNNSLDDTRKYLDEIKNSRIITKYLDQNYGFSKAVNEGIKISRGEFVLLLNSDIVVQKKSFFDLLKFAKKNKDAGVIGAKLVNPDGTPQSSVYNFPSPTGAIKEYWFGQKSTFEKYLPIGENPVSVDAIVGAVMLIPKKTVEVVGIFDEKYFMYFEDLDYCKRVKNAGLKVYFLPKVLFVHHHGASGKKVSGGTQNWLIDSSKKFHGLGKYWFITLIIRTSQIYNKLILNKK